MTTATPTKTSIADLVRQRGEQARRKALAILEKPKPTKAELDRLPGLLSDAALTVADAERASALMAERDALQTVIDAADHAAVSALTDQLRDHQAETQRIAAERREQQRDLERQLDDAKRPLTQARQAEARMVQVTEELRRQAGEPEPDLAEAYIVCPSDGSSSAQCPPLLQAPASCPVVSVTGAAYRRELERRRRALSAFDAKTLTERRGRYRQADTEWIEQFNAQAHERDQCYQEADRLSGKGKHHAAAKERAEAQRLLARLGPRPQFERVSYADCIAAGEHRVELESEAQHAA